VTVFLLEKDDMLTDAALKSLKPREKPYKVADRDAMYVLVSTADLSFKLDYRMNGRRETLTLGKYGPSGLSLAERARCASMRAAQSMRANLPQSRSSARSAD